MSFSSCLSHYIYHVVCRVIISDGTKQPRDGQLCIDGAAAAAAAAAADSAVFSNEYHT